MNFREFLNYQQPSKNIRNAIDLAIDPLVKGIETTMGSIHQKYGGGHQTANIEPLYRNIHAAHAHAGYEKLSDSDKLKLRIIPENQFFDTALGYYLLKITVPYKYGQQKKYVMEEIQKLLYNATKKGIINSNSIDANEIKTYILHQGISSSGKPVATYGAKISKI